MLVAVVGDPMSSQDSDVLILRFGQRAAACTVAYRV